MTEQATQHVLAVSPSPRGFAFVLFQGSLQPFDWGVKDIRGSQKNPLTIAEIKKLIRRFRPEALVIEEPAAGDSRRGPRIRTLLRLIIRLTEKEGVAMRQYSRSDVQKAFKDANARTRPEIAKAIAEKIPTFAPKLPPLRKIWMSEDPRQSLFDAAALGVTFYAKAEKGRG